MSTSAQRVILSKTLSFRASRRNGLRTQNTARLFSNEMRSSGMHSWLLASRPIVVDASIEIVSPQRGPARTTSLGFIAIDAFKQNDCRASPLISESRGRFYPIGDGARAAEATRARTLRRTLNLASKTNEFASWRGGRRRTTGPRRE